MGLADGQRLRLVLRPPDPPHMGLARLFQRFSFQTQGRDQLGIKRTGRMGPAARFQIRKQAGGQIVREEWLRADDSVQIRRLRSKGARF